jgi:nicotinate-nucleotide adenylyltransferase
MRRIGLLGGTFDPPHLGHLVVAEAVRDVLDLDEVWLLVAGDPWMKNGQSLAHHRVSMARLAAEGNPALVVDDRETRRDGPTYSADTLTELHAEHPDDAFTFIVGADTAAHMPKWDRVEQALALADWVMVGRPGTDWPRHDLAGQLRVVEVPGIDISSSDVRDRIRDGRSVRYLVPQAVLDYIDEHRLYRAADRPGQSTDG